MNNRSAVVRLFVCFIAPLILPLSASAEAVLAVSPTSVSVQASAGQNAPSQTVQIRNAGNRKLRWSISESVGWFSVSPMSGGNSSTVTVSFQSSTLAAGSYSGSFIVTANTGATQAVTVNLTVAAGTAPPPQPPTVTLTGLSIVGPSSLTVGQTAQYTARAAYSDGSSLLLASGTPPSWSTSNSSVATITLLGGLLTAVGGGTVTVQAIYGGVTAQLGVSVAASTQPPTVTLTGLSIVGPSSLTVGQTAQYTAKATYSDGTTQSLTTGPSWSTSSSSLASVTQAGVLTALGAGTVAVRAIYGGLTAQMGVSVAASTPPPTVTLTGLSIVGPSSLTVGQTAQYTAKATYSDGTTQSLTTGTPPSWSTSSSSLATITQAGVLTALGAGTVTVQAIYGGLTAQLGVSVAASTQPPVSPPSASAVGPQSTITCPAGAVDIWPGANIQTIVNSNVGNTTFCLRAGVYALTSAITPKTGNTFVGEYGAILDGSGWATSDDTQAAFRSHNQDIDYVTIRNLVIRNMPQRGIHAYYYLADHWTIEYNEIASNYTGIVFPPYTMIRNNSIHHNSFAGYMGPYVSYSTFDSNEIAYNGWEQKVAGSTNATFRNNFVHHNVGAGIWYDYDNVGGLVEGNRVEDNGWIGIFYEVSSDGIIRNNTIRRNAEAGVMLSVSKNTQIYNNTIDNNFRGITYFLNCPSVGTGTIGFDLTNNTAHDNTITVGTQSGAFASLFSYGSCTTTQVAPYVNGSKNNTFSHNTYHVPSPTTGRYWLWNGAAVPVKYWNEWQAIPQDATGTVSQ